MSSLKQADWERLKLMIALMLFIKQPVLILSSSSLINSFKSNKVCYTREKGLGLLYLETQSFQNGSLETGNNTRPSNFFFPAKQAQFFSGKMLLFLISSFCFSFLFYSIFNMRMLNIYLNLYRTQHFPGKL